MTTTEELIQILECDDDEEFVSDEEFDIDEQVIIYFINLFYLNLLCSEKR